MLPRGQLARNRWRPCLAAACRTHGRVSRCGAPPRAPRWARPLCWLSGAQKAPPARRRFGSRRLRAREEMASEATNTITAIEQPWRSHAHERAGLRVLHAMHAALPTEARVHLLDRGVVDHGGGVPIERVGGERGAGCWHLCAQRLERRSHGCCCLCAHRAAGPASGTAALRAAAPVAMRPDGCSKEKQCCPCEQRVQHVMARSRGTLRSCACARLAHGTDRSGALSKGGKRGCQQGAPPEAFTHTVCVEHGTASRQRARAPRTQHSGQPLAHCSSIGCTGS